MANIKESNDVVNKRVQCRKQIICSGCKLNKGTKKCGGCKSVYYCSQKCQSNDWKNHKSECKKIRKQNAKQKMAKSPKKSKQNLNKSLAENIQKQYRKENKKRRTPRIKVTKAVNGIFKVKLLNEFLRNRKHSIQFQYDYRFLNDNAWKSTTFTSDMLENNGLIYVRMPLNLKGYHIKCRLRARLILEDIKQNNEEKKWFDFSKEYKVSIPSSMIGTEFDIGDIVRYKPENDYVLSLVQAEITEKLPNGYVRLKHKKSADIPQLIIREDSFVLHQSRVAYTDSVSSRHLLDFTNLDLKMDQTLLLKLNDSSETDAKMRTYKRLTKALEGYAMFWKVLNGGNKHCRSDNFYIYDVKLSSIAKFVSRNVMQYLFDTNEFEWKINACILNHNHGALKCLECLRAYFIKRNIEELERGDNIGNMDGRYQICDVCSVSVDQFEYVYHCSAKMEDRHDICLNCIYAMIKQSAELSGLLMPIMLSDSNSSNVYTLDNDCIDVIVSFVVGKVVKIAY